ncbi:hypothetical protein HHI36_003894 [Cryptolaemus montrouzieri]|uniref:Uncharacterized protein n=1 Tax=Cryptolaemus montrouzieri TaxID=559131 RepID=A0ABD2NQ08_9CUCU
MRLKSSDGPISIHSVNDVLNSPKRINTLQNSNITSNLTSNSNLTNTVGNGETTELTSGRIRNIDTLNNVQNELVKVQWCNSAREKQRELSNNVNNQQRNQLVNINNTLAASLRNATHARRGKPASICSESSPDDSLFDYEEAHQSGSSTDATPQDEDRGFDISDTESLSDDGNLNRRRRQKTVLQRRGIVNPNYPGFQHFAHTLDFTIKVSSDTDFTDDDYECEVVSSENRTQFIEKDDEYNNINNNNVEETDDRQVDKIDSVNRLDSVENIQKVFYDKPVLNLDCENLNQNFSDLESSSNNSNQVSDEDITEKLPFQKIEVKLNIRAEEVSYKTKNSAEEELETKYSEDIHVAPQDFPEIPAENIVGDFGKEVEDEFGRIAHQNSINVENLKFDFQVHFEPSWERAVVQEIEEAIEKLTELLDFEPTAYKYEFEPNDEQPFSKSPSTQEEKLNVAVVAETSEDTSELPAELLDFEPIAQQFKLQETLAESLQRLSPCRETCPVILQDSQIVHSDMAPTLDNKLTIQNFDTNQAEFKTESNDIAGTKTRIRNFEKMEVESEINELKRDSNRQLEEIECQIKKMKSDTTLSPKSEKEVEKFCKEDMTKDLKEKDEDTVKRESDHVVRRRRDYNQQFGSLIQFPRKDSSKIAANRRSVPAAKEKKKTSIDNYGSFDVYNIETAMPKIDLEAIELHLRAAREEERRVSWLIFLLLHV